METCKHGSGAGSRKPTAEMRQGVECRAYIVKNGLPASCIEEYVRCVFDNAKVDIKDENAVSVDIEVTGKNKLHSLEGLKELEYYFKEYDIRIW